MKAVVKPILNGVLCMILCVSVLLPFGLYFSGRPAHTTDRQPALVAEHLIDIKGFNYTRSRFDRETLAIKADRLTITKQKIGHVNLGGFATVRLENATVHLYGLRLDATPHADGHPSPIIIESAMGGIDMPFPSVNRILSINMAPVRIELFSQGRVAIRISAASAAIRAKRGDLVFNRGATVDSGPRRLKARRLSISSDFNVVKALGPYVLTTPAGEFTGNRLSTDIYLNAVGASASSISLRLAAN